MSEHRERSLSGEWIVGGKGGSQRKEIERGSGLREDRERRFREEWIEGAQRKEMERGVDEEAQRKEIERGVDGRRKGGITGKED